MTNLEIKPKSFIDTWTKRFMNQGNITHIHVQPKSEGVFVNFPPDLHVSIQKGLQEAGIQALFAHQEECYRLIRAKRNVLINTGTATGKTLSFFLPILNDFIHSDGFANALFLFPTKALGYDQLQQYETLRQNTGHFLPKNQPIPLISTYDGDTAQNKRAEIRKSVNFLLTNPDMLHFAILPYHTLWEKYLRNLKYVVIDEIHTYRGVFGSQVANIIRRLKRICAFYGHELQFISTSATIGNPKDFVEKLLEVNISIINENASPSGEKSIIFYNPPIENERLGLRKSAFAETVRIATDFSENQIQTLVFQLSRKGVEKSLKVFQDNFCDKKIKAQAYRSGYLAKDRRNLEAQLRSGEITLLFSTNALELGMDIGGISNVILSGYPGSITSTLQQIGRAGRKMNISSAVLIANSSPIDQFLINHPEYILLRSPETALIDPQNELILLQHLRCAASELMFERGENFGNLDWSVIEPFLSQISSAGDLMVSDKKFFWISSQQPHYDISLRNISGATIKLFDEESNKVIGQVDYASSLWMVHEGAVYMQQGEEYLVKELDLENNRATLQKKALNYFTEARKDTKIEILETLENAAALGLELSFGNIKVTNKIVGFDEFLWDTNEKMASKDLQLPEIILDTQAVWFPFSEQLIKTLREKSLWIDDPNQYGPRWKEITLKVRQRDQFTCQGCGISETDRRHHVHHVKPLRLFDTLEEANYPSNLITLCPKCHQRVELTVKVRTGLGGLKYLASNMAPLFLMCDFEDIGVFTEQASSLVGGKPLFLLYENIPYGIGLSRQLFQITPAFFSELRKLVHACPCKHGCPSCVGPEVEAGYGGKAETLAILEAMLG